MIICIYSQDIHKIWKKLFTNISLTIKLYIHTNASENARKKNLTGLIPEILGDFFPSEIFFVVFDTLTLFKEQDSFFIKNCNTFQKEKKSVYKM